MVLRPLTVAESPPGESPPSAPTLTAPADEATLTIDEEITLSATSPDGDLTRIDFVLDPTGPGTGGTIIGTDSAAPYSQPWTVAGSEGAHTIVARAVRGGLATDSAAVDVTLQAAAGARTLVVQTFLADGDFNPGGSIESPGGTADTFDGEVWAPGAGGTTAVGGGGGGGYSRKNAIPYSGSAVAFAGLAGAAANTNSTDATIGTTLCVAKGANSGANGGTAADNVTNGTGDIKFNGAPGTLGAGNAAGGGGAGSNSHAGTVGGGSTNAQGGRPQGGLAVTAQAGRVMGAGGGSTAGSQLAGARGEGRAHYTIAAPASTVRTLGISQGRDVTDATTTAITLPTSIDASPDANEVLLLEIASDGTSVLSIPGWTQVGTQLNHSTSSHCVAVFKFDASSADPAGAQLTITKAATQSLSWEVRRIGNADFAAIEMSSVVDQTSTNADAPNHTPTTGAGNYLVIALHAWDGALTSLSAGPSTYESMIFTQDQQALGCSLFTASKNINGTSENPGACTSSSAAWIGATISVRAAA